MNRVFLIILLTVAFCNGYATHYSNKYICYDPLNLADTTYIWPDSIRSGNYRGNFEGNPWTSYLRSDVPDTVYGNLFFNRAVRFGNGLGDSSLGIAPYSYMQLFGSTYPPYNTERGFHIRAVRYDTTKKPFSIIGYEDWPDTSRIVVFGGLDNGALPNQFYWLTNTAYFEETGIYDYNGFVRMKLSASGALVLRPSIGLDSLIGVPLGAANRFNIYDPTDRKLEVWGGSYFDRINVQDSIRCPTLHGTADTSLLLKHTAINKAFPGDSFLLGSRPDTANAKIVFNGGIKSTGPDSFGTTVASGTVSAAKFEMTSTTLVTYMRKMEIPALGYNWLGDSIRAVSQLSVINSQAGIGKNNYWILRPRQDNPVCLVSDSSSGAARTNDSLNYKDKRFVFSAPVVSDTLKTKAIVMDSTADTTASSRAGLIEYNGKRFWATPSNQTRGRIPLYFPMPLLYDSLYNSDSLAVVCSLRVGANSINTLDICRFRLLGRMSTANATDVLTIAFYSGADSLIAITTAPKNVSNTPVDIEFILITRTIGAGGTISCYAKAEIDNFGISSASLGTVAFNTTTTNTIKVRTKWSSANAGNKFVPLPPYAIW